MKFLMSFLVAMCLSSFAFAGTPYSPEVNKRFKTLEALPSNVSYTSTGISNLRVVRASFDSATMGTSSATAYSLGVTLPANALIWDGVLYVDSTFTPASGAGSVAIECEDSKNILADQTVNTWATGQKKALTPVGTAASAVSSIGAACAVSARVSAANVVGKFTVWIMYFVTN
jgi:hypothetical protein